MQDLAQGIVARQVKELQPKHDLNNAALVAMRPGSGEVLAMVGSADFNDTAISGQVNVARSLRQPGSAIKPVLYATALSDNLISPATVLWDVPVTYTVGSGVTYPPANYDGKFHGPVTVRTALANSYNVPAVKLLDALTVDRMLQSAKTLGIRSLSRDKDWYGLSLTLGGGEVTLLDLTTAFATLASGGRSVTPEPILAVDWTPWASPWTAPCLQPGEPVQAVSPAAAFQVTDILSDNTARTPMFGAASPLKLSRPAAAKTGTTADYRDNWTAGYTRYLVAGVWAGNTDGRPMKSASGIAGAAPIWHDFMEGVLADKALLATLQAPGRSGRLAVHPAAGRGATSRLPAGRRVPGGRRILQPGMAGCGRRRGPLGRQRQSKRPRRRSTRRCRTAAGGRRIAGRSRPPCARCSGCPASSACRASPRRPRRTEPASLSTDVLHAIGWSLRHPTAGEPGVV